MYHHVTVEFVPGGIDYCNRIACTCRNGTPTLEEMQAAVGGNIETGFRLVSLYRENVEIDYYVNEEGLLFEGNQLLQYEVCDPNYDNDPYTFAGNGIFVASNEDGETIGLTADEVEWIQTNITITNTGATT